MKDHNRLGNKSSTHKINKKEQSHHNIQQQNSYNTKNILQTIHQNNKYINTTNTFTNATQNMQCKHNSVHTH